MRIQVKRFAEEMEKVLKQNDYKSGWQTCSDDYLYHHLLEETRELFVALYYYKRSDKKRRRYIIKECADVANFAMMIADKFLKLEDK